MSVCFTSAITSNNTYNLMIADMCVDVATHVAPTLEDNVVVLGFIFADVVLLGFVSGNVVLLGFCFC